MELGYRLTITDENGGAIFLSSMREDCQEDGRVGEIVKAFYKTNTIDDNVLSKSNDSRAEIIVKGRITEFNKEETCKLASWSIETDSNLIYRTVKLVTYTSTDKNAKMLRSYEIEQMFVLDYTEEFNNSSDDNEASSGNFELYVVQKKGNHSQYIETE
ncbi:MAG: hypothetical protein IJN05_06415 [Ruminococcus sp.]|nr:hypothetical protein [Ruminococcus sp.]